jgi:hypothetical protein
LKRFLIYAVCGAVPIFVFLRLPMGTWADFGGLPNHPLVVHLIVVLVPAVGIWAIVAAWKPKVLAASFPYLYAAAVVCALGSIVAKSSGDSLAAAVGLPKAHAAAGDRMVSFTIALAVIILVLGAISQLWAKRPAVMSARVLVTIVGVAALPLTYIAGHTGAEATWEQAYAEAQAPIQPEPVGYTMADVERRNTAEECWTVVDGTIYDVSSFIARHPAGSQDIINMCGKDASESFLGQHAGQGEPEKWLATLKVGTL